MLQRTWLMIQAYKKLFGIHFKEDSLLSDDLPVYLTAGRSFHKLSYADSAFVLVQIPDNEKFGVVAFEKQLAKLSAHYNLPVAFGFKNVSRTQRDSLIERGIPFISDSGQLFLPFLGMSLSDHFIKQKEINANKMMPTTQALFLYMTYKSKNKPVKKMTAAKDLHVTKTSITRASDQLLAMDLIKQDTRGKEVYMSTVETGIQLYRKARPFLINPIQRKIITSRDSKYERYPLSGESALAKHTMLNTPKIPARATDKNNIIVDRVSIIDARWNPDADIMCLELWKYDPVLFAHNKTVDPISLALCFKDNVDERIEGAIEEYLEVYQW